MKPTRTLLFVVNDPAFFLSHRLPIALEARSRGYDVQIATGVGSSSNQIQALGFAFHELPLSRSGQNVVAELRTLAAIVGLFRRVRPDIVHLVTIKPVLYGGIAARLTGVPAVVGAVSGLGTVFLARGGAASLKRRIVKSLYRLAFGHPNIAVIFQNRDDQSTFLDGRIVDHHLTRIIPGSGIDLAQFAKKSEPQGPLKVTMASRLLHDKGVDEFVAAATIIKRRWPEVIFQLAGDIDPANRTSLTAEEYRQIETAGNVRLLGYQRDIAQLFAQSSIVVLPSYREGLPKVLVEAAAAGRAVVTTDVPGCRDAIIPNVSGLLVPVADAGSLALAIEELILSPEKRLAMGEAGTRLAQSTFAIESIVSQHLDIYSALTNRSD